MAGVVVLALGPDDSNGGGGGGGGGGGARNRPAARDAIHQKEA